MAETPFPQLGVVSGTPTADQASLPSEVATEISINNVTTIAKSDTVAVPYGRLFAVVCTVAGDVKVTFAGGGTYTFPVSVGHSLFPFQITKVWTTGTTATATFVNMI